MEENTDLAKQYQDILDQYSKELAANPVPDVNVPEPEIPPQIPLTEIPPPPPAPISNSEPVEELPPPPVFISQPPKNNNFFKILFFISLVIFLGVCGAILYTFISANPNSIKKTTPSAVSPSPTISTNVCRLNDQVFQVGQSFWAADNCNTCACQADLTIACTQKACVATPSVKLTPTQSATVSATKVSLSTVKPISGKVDTQIVLTGTGFASTGNVVVLGSTSIEENNCSFFYNNLTSADSKTINFKLALVPSEIRCGGVQGSDTTKPTKIPSGKYYVSVNVGNQGSYTKAKLVNFTVLE